MKKIRCEIRLTTGGTEEVDAYEAAPGLAVYQDSAGWYVTHISSGFGATPRTVHLSKRKEAIRFAKCLAEVIDFTLPHQQLEAIATVIDSIVERFNKGYRPEEKAKHSRPVLRVRR